MNEEMEIDQPKGTENDQQETDMERQELDKGTDNEDQPKEVNKDGEDQPNDDPAIQNQIVPLVIIIIDKMKQVLTNTTGFFLKIKVKIFFG